MSNQNNLLKLMWDVEECLQFADILIEANYTEIKPKN